MRENSISTQVWKEDTSAKFPVCLRLNLDLCHLPLDKLSYWPVILTAYGSVELTLIFHGPVRLSVFSLKRHKFPAVLKDARGPLGWLELWDIPGADGSRTRLTAMFMEWSKVVWSNNTCGTGQVKGEGWRSCDVGSHVLQRGISEATVKMKSSALPGFLTTWKTVTWMKNKFTFNYIVQTVLYSSAFSPVGLFVYCLTTALADESSIILVARERSDLVTSMAWPPEIRARSWYSWTPDCFVFWGLLEVLRLTVNTKFTWKYQNG